MVTFPPLLRGAREWVTKPRWSLLGEAEEVRATCRKRSVDVLNVELATDNQKIAVKME